MEDVTRVTLPALTRYPQNAAPHLSKNRLFNAAMCAALFAAARRGWRLVVAFLGGAGLFAFIGLLIWTAGIASRAGRAAGGPTDLRGVPSQTPVMPDTTALLSGPAMTVVGWICAVAACGVTVFLLGTIIDGYALAIHQRDNPIPPSGSATRRHLDACHGGTPPRKPASAGCCSATVQC
jgi:hypothetical protein